MKHLQVKSFQEWLMSRGTVVRNCIGADWNAMFPLEIVMIPQSTRRVLVVISKSK